MPCLPGRPRNCGRIWHVLFWIGLIVALLAAFLFSLASGRYRIPIGHVISIISSHLGRCGGDLDADREHGSPDRWPLPRVLMTAVAGAGLSLCGAVLQGILATRWSARKPSARHQARHWAASSLSCSFGFGLWARFGLVAAAAALLAVLAIHRTEQACRRS